jgi:hypothetical protein
MRRIGRVIDPSDIAAQSLRKAYDTDDIGATSVNRHAELVNQQRKADAGRAGFEPKSWQLQISADQ